jgi:putative transposase
MSRYRLYPTPSQQAALLVHCAHARYVWNLAVEQRSWWQPGRRLSPGFAEQCRQLTQARAAFPWLAKGSVIVQQQALRDFQQAWMSYVAAVRVGRQRRAAVPRDEGPTPTPPAPPGYRKRGRHDGFRIVAVRTADVRRLNRRWGAVSVPKVGWVRFRWSRPVPAAKSWRVTRDRAGRWHIAFAAVPPAIPAPGNGQIVGVDRGVIVSAALSTGELLFAPTLRPRDAQRLRQLQRRLARARRGSTRRAQVKRAIARLTARQADRRRNWAEQTSTDLARRFDLIRVEDLNVRAMTASAKGSVEKPGRNVRQKAVLNRGILGQSWGLLVARLEDKAPGRIERIQPAFTSQRCHACGHIARESRESQARFRCLACGHTANADVNAACNIAAGRAVPARGGQPLGQPANREPHHAASSVA